MGRYDGKHAVITGGTSGIGLATAALLAEAGARVLVTGHRQDAIDRAQGQLGDRVLAVHSDAASLPAIEALAERVRSEFGTLDALFVNAGISRTAPLEAVTEEEYDEVLTVNAKGPYFTVQHLAPLLADGAGVVLTTSVSNVKGLPGNSVYAASKAALRSMTRTLARDLLPRGVRVNAVSPGPVDTGVLAKSLPPGQVEAVMARFRENNPMHRFGRPQEVARAAVFLAFDATFTTGAELPVDGGVSQL